MDAARPWILRQACDSLEFARVSALGAPRASTKGMAEHILGHTLRREEQHSHESRCRPGAWGVAPMTCVNLAHTLRPSRACPHLLPRFAYARGWTGVSPLGRMVALPVLSRRHGPGRARSCTCRLGCGEGAVLRGRCAPPIPGDLLLERAGARARASTERFPLGVPQDSSSRCLAGGHQLVLGKSVGARNVTAFALVSRVFGRPPW